MDTASTAAVVPGFVTCDAVQHTSSTGTWLALLGPMNGMC